MTKVKSKNKLQKRDWAIILLVVVVVASNFIWYGNFKTQDITNRNDTAAWLAHQVEINKLKACVDNNTHPCDITPPKQ